MNEKFVEMSAIEMENVSGGGALGVLGGTLIILGAIASGGGALVVGAGVFGGVVTIVGAL